MRVLVTGASGSVGRVVSATLEAAGHDVVRQDIKPDLRHPHPNPHPKMLVGDLAEPGIAQRAAEGCEVIIHLAAYPISHSLPLADRFAENLLQPNVMGMLRVCDAAMHHKTPRLILASSVQVFSGRKLDDEAPTNPRQIARPWNAYALSKQWAEDTGALVARCSEVAVLAVRIGWFLRNEEEKARLEKSGWFDGYLSHDDAGRFFVAAAEGTFTGFHILYAFSKGKDGSTRVDEEPERRLIGYEPRDIFPEGTSFPPGGG